jgi:hypothetical protein
VTHRCPAKGGYSDVVSCQALTQSGHRVRDERKMSTLSFFLHTFTSLNSCVTVSFTVLYTSPRAALLVCRSNSFDSTPAHGLHEVMSESGLRVVDVHRGRGIVKSGRYGLMYTAQHFNIPAASGVGEERYTNRTGGVS